MTPEQKLTIIIACYAAGVATLVAIAQIVDVIRRRPSLKISGYKVSITNGRKNEGVVHVVVHNSGRRAITVLNAGVMFGKKPSLTTDKTKQGSGTVYLADNKAVDYELPYDIIKIHEKKHNHKITKVFCEVAGGKIYKGKFRH